MHAALHHQRFTQLLNQFSEKLDDLLSNARRFDPKSIPLELLDEIAVTIGELTLLLSDHLAIEHTQTLAQKIISRANELRQGMRSGELSSEQLSGAIGALIREIHLILFEDKRAA
jgi:hypothetical protein